MTPRDTSIALRRFGLGAKPGDTRRISSDPRGYVEAALKDPASALILGSELEPSDVIFVATRNAQEAQKLAREQMKMTSEAAPADAAQIATPPPAAAANAKRPPLPDGVLRPGEVRRDAARSDVEARFQRAVSSDSPYLERLVIFWSNHFCVSMAKGNVRGLAGAYEREAIRPHVLGRFADMLKAVERHPAMLIYLDNQVSIGPSSPAGLRTQKGLNENLARETLELHTLGVHGGYSQTDVTNFARIITGWTIGQPNQPVGQPGKFFFGPQRHEPGSFTVLGKRYPDQGAETGLAVLDDLARHPATARNIATKFATHFVSDAPPPGLVDTLAKRFLETDGNLKELALALVKSDDAWGAAQKKVVPPFDFTVAVARGLGLSPKPGEVIRLAAALGQPLWQPPSPKGWPEDDDAWMGPSAIRERLRMAERAARDADHAIDPRALSEDLLGPILSDETKQAIARAETREQGLEILIMSPEFQRR